MLRLRLENAKPGMKLAMPVSHPARPTTVLLRAGVTLDPTMIDRLGEIGAKEMWIDHPAIRDLNDRLHPKTLRAQASVAATTIEAIDSALSGCDGRLDYLRYRSTLQNLVRALLEVPQSTMFVQEMIRGGRPALAHAANVCIMSVMMGMRMADYLVAERTRLREWHAQDVTNLGLGAMFHDIGMLRLSEAALERWRTNHDEFDPSWREHPTIGWKLVREQIGPAGAAAVLHHHQRFNGSGFPSIIDSRGAKRAVVGEDIHVFGRIVAAADTLDALRYPGHEAPTIMTEDDEDLPAQEAAMPTVRALKQMQSPPHADRLDPLIFLALLSIAPPYAPGTIVGLSTGESALVTDWTALDPCRPAVRTIDLEDVGGSLEDAKNYSLAVDRSITIVRAEGFDVSGDNFYPETPASFSLESLANQRRSSPGRRAG